jgi:hypothetical protein
MSMMTAEQVAEFLGVQNVRVERLEREKSTTCCRERC